MDEWDTIVEEFSDPAAAFIFAQTLDVLKELIRTNSKQAENILDEGIQKLFPRTDFYYASYKLYILALEGNLKPQHDPTFIIEEMGAQTSTPNISLVVVEPEHL